MTTRSLHVRAVVRVAAAIALTGCSLAARTMAPDHASHVTPHPTAAVTVFCGPSVTNTAWKRQLAALADIGVTAVHGPCYTPPADYSVVHPGSRYATQAEYLALATEAQRLGLGVIVYDPMFWEDPERAAAAWAPFIADGTLVAVDLGDEPSWTDMPILAERAERVRSAGVEPQVIFLNGRIMSVVDQYRALPTACPISDDYEQPWASMTDTSSLWLEAGCAGIAVDTTGRDLAGNGDGWSLDLIARARAAGFRLTLFTGVAPENYPEWDALVDDAGRLTPAGLAVKGALA